MASLTLSRIEYDDPRITRLVRAAEIAIGLLECHARPDQVAIALKNALNDFHKGETHGNRATN